MRRGFVDYAKKRMEAKEVAVLNLLAEAYNEFAQLPQYHPDDIKEFVDSIHKAQNILAFRIASRERPELFNTPLKK